jgi:Protein of unknown function (DUF2917)
MSRLSLTFPTPVFGREGLSLKRAVFDSTEMWRGENLTCWTLPGGQAMRLKTGRAGSLRVSSGRIWLTFSHTGYIDEQGQVRSLNPASGCDDDLMLQAGQSVGLAVGDSVVFEPFAIAGTLDAGLQWRSHGSAT